MKKIKKQSDWNKFFSNITDGISARSTVDKYKSISFFNVFSIDEFIKNIGSCEPLKKEITLCDFLYIMGAHASGKQKLSSNLIESVYKNTDIFWHDWRKLRDSLVEFGRPIPINSLYPGLVEVERAHIAFVARMIGAGNMAIVSDCGLNPVRREKILRACGIDFYSKFAIAIVLLPSLQSLLANNVHTRSYWEINRTYNSYYESLKFIIPAFREGWRKVIYINETKPGDQNYVDNDDIKNDYLRIYESSEVVIEHFEV